MARTLTVSDYIAKSPPKARKALKQLRTAIKAAAPGVTERISYRIPTFELDGRYLLYRALGPGVFRPHLPVALRQVVSEKADLELDHALAPWRPRRCHPPRATRAVSSGAC
jgi:hypothetical protein